MSAFRRDVQRDVFIWGWLGLGCVSMVLVGMRLHPLTTFSESLFWPPDSPGITPVSEGTQTACYLWITAGHRIKHIASVLCFLYIE